MDPNAPTNAGVITVGSTRIAAAGKNVMPTSISYFIDPGAKVKKDVGMRNDEIRIVPWRTA